MNASTRGEEFSGGWFIVLSSFIGTACGVSALIFYSIGLFIKPLQAEFGWSRTELSFAALLGAATMAVSSPLIGRVIDRHGGRRVAALSILGLGLGFFALSYLQNSLPLYYAMIIALATLGAGSSPVVYSRAINQWFDKARGLALGLALTGTGVAAIAVPRLLSPYVTEHGWRAGYTVLALTALLSLLPVVLLLREKSTAATATASGRTIPLTGLTRAQAFRDRRFWFMGTAFFLVSTAVTGIVVHFVPLLTDAGITPQRAGATTAIVGVAVVVGRCTSGLLLDRFHAPIVAAALFCLTMVGCLAIPLGGIGLAPLAAFFIGLALGGEVDMIGYMVARYFGMRAYGAIYGWQYAAFLIGNAISPMLAGAVFDEFGGYTPALLGAAVCLLVAAVLCLFLGPYPGPYPEPYYCQSSCSRSGVNTEQACTRL